MRGALVIVIAFLLNVTCVRHHYPQRARILTGTCEGTCDYYQDCKEARDGNAYRACVSDCRAIFSEDGEMDRSSLRELESLECPKLVSYIEGSSGRGPGETGSTPRGADDATSQLP